jgi:CheY-like chemotaxis protein
LLRERRGSTAPFLPRRPIGEARSPSLARRFVGQPNNTEYSLSIALLVPEYSPRSTCVLDPIRAKALYQPIGIMKLLLIEDRRSTALLHKADLERAGFLVETASTETEGSERANTEVFDVVVLDWTATGGDGRAAVRHLHESRSEAPILMLSAISEEEDRMQGADFGADACLMKPFLAAELVNHVQALCVRRLPTN